MEESHAYMPTTHSEGTMLHVTLSHSTHKAQVAGFSSLEYKQSNIGPEKICHLHKSSCDRVEQNPPSLMPSELTAASSRTQLSQTRACARYHRPQQTGHTRAAAESNIWLSQLHSAEYFIAKLPGTICCLSSC